MDTNDSQDPREHRPGEPPHESMAENLREEVRDLHDRVEEAVEHALPPRVRWTAGRIAWLVVGSLFAVVVIATGGAILWITRHTETVAGHLTLVVNRILAEHGDMVLEVRDVRGNPFRSLSVVEPRLRIRGSSGPPLLAARSMKLAYAPWDLAFGRRRAIQIELDRPVVRIERRADGRWRLPVWRAGTPSGRPPRAYDLAIAIRGGEVDLPDSSQDVSGWDLDATIRTGTPERIEVARMRWDRGPWDSRLEQLAGSFLAGDSAVVELRTLRTADLELSGAAGWRRGSRARIANLEVRRVRWRWLARVFRNTILDVDGQGSGSFRLRGERGWSGSGEAQAVWDSVPVALRAAFLWENGSLTVSPLHGSSPAAGDFDGRLVYTSQDLDLRGRVAHSDPASWHAIGLRGWPAGDVSGAMHYWSWRRTPAGSRLDATLTGSTIAGWRADSARVSVNAPSQAPGTFSVAMFRRGGRVDLAADMERGTWGGTWKAAGFPLEEWPDGRASGIRGLLAQGQGTVESRGGALEVNGALGGDPVEWLGITARSWRLDRVAGALLPKPDLELPELTLRNAFFLGLHFDSVRAAVHVGDGEARLERVLAFAGDTVLTVQGANTWGRAGWTATLDQAEARSSQFHWIAEGPVELSGDPRGVTFQRFVARDGDARIEAHGRWATPPAGSYEWTGTATSLDLHRLGMPLDWDLRGRADAELAVSGVSGDPHWTFHTRVMAPGMRGHAGDSLRISLVGAPSRLAVQQFAWELGGGSVEGHLEVDGTGRPWPDTLTADGIRRWLSDAASWTGRVNADAFPLERLGNLVPAARGLSGRLGGGIDISGRPDQPVLALQARAAPMAWDSLAADRVVLRAMVRDQRLEVPELRVEQGPGVSTASGGMPLRLALGSAPRVSSAPMSWKIDLENGDLAILPRLVPEIALARGRLDLHATVGGTPQRPTVSGSGSARDGQMMITGRSELIQDLRASFRLNETRITMDSLYARSGKRGTIRANGAVDLNGSRMGHYSFDLAMNDFVAEEPGIWAAEFDAPHLVVTDGPHVKGQPLPHVEGDVKLRAARVYFDFANQSENQQLAATTQPLFCTYRLHLIAASNLRWQPPDADVEFSADLTAEQTDQSLNLFGDVSAIRGTYNLYSNRFTVDKADLTFDNVGGVNPTLDLEATTRVIPVAGTETSLGLASGAAADQSPHTITVTITGRANNPSIQFTSDPSDWDQPTILSQLTVGRFIVGNRLAVTQLSDPLDSYVTRMINAQLSPALSRTFLGEVGQWQLERQQGGLFAGQGDLYVTVNRQFNPRIQVSYTRRLPGLERPGATNDLTTTPGTTNAPDLNLLEQNVGAEYRINRFFYVTTELSQRRSQAAVTLPTLVPEFNVNLRARWEY